MQRGTVAVIGDIKSPGVREMPDAKTFAAGRTRSGQRTSRMWRHQNRDLVICRSDPVENHAESKCNQLRPLATVYRPNLDASSIGVLPEVTADNRRCDIINAPPGNAKLLANGGPYQGISLQVRRVMPEIETRRCPRTDPTSRLAGTAQTARRKAQ